MRLYSASSEETLRARRLLKEWAGEGILTREQTQRLEHETVSELRTTNIFLRLVLFFFTLIIVGSAVGLFFVVFLQHSSEQTAGAFLLIFAAFCYGVAEVIVSQFRLYRYGIEEALVVFSVGFLCVGLDSAFFGGSYYSAHSERAHSLVLAAGAIASLWIWRRFGLWYAFPAAMIFVVFLPDYWTSSHPVQHVLVSLFYAIGLICVVAVRSRHRNDYLDSAYSLVEALLWLGIYLAINLKISSLNLPPQWGIGGTRVFPEFARPFYWTTWVLIWCLPPVILVRGIRRKDRFVIWAGAMVAILTLVSNKPYLGWTRHTWDPMLLGIVLIGIAVFIQRWLARGTNGIRHGFTAVRLSGKDKQWMSAGSTVLGLVSPRLVTPSSQATSPGVRFGGGASGGGGASSDF